MNEHKYQICKQFIHSADLRENLGILDNISLRHISQALRLGPSLMTLGCQMTAEINKGGLQPSRVVAPHRHTFHGTSNAVRPLLTRSLQQ